MGFHSVAPDVARGNSFCVFDLSVSFPGHFLVFWHHKMFQAHLILSLLCPFSGESYLESKIWILGELVPLGMSLLPGILSEQGWEQK